MATIEEVYDAVMILLDVMYEPHDFIDWSKVDRNLMDNVLLLNKSQAQDVQWAFLHELKRQVVDGRTDL